MKNVVNRALAAKKTKLFTLLFAVLASVGVMKGENTSLYLLDSTITVNEKNIFSYSKAYYEYSDKGEKTRYTHLYSSWSKWPVGVPMILNRKTIFIYDDQEKVKETYYSRLDTATGIWKDEKNYILDAQNNKIYSVREWNADSTAALSGSRHYYDDNHLLIKTEGFDTWNGIKVITDKYFYYYDEHGYKISLCGQFRPDSAYEGDYKSDPEKFNQSGWKYVDSAYYERNAAGQSLKETFFRWDEENNSWLKDGYQIFTYNNKGYQLTDTVFARDFETNIITYNSYSVNTYDSHDNNIRIATYIPEFTDGQVQWKFTYATINEYTYDDKGLITEKRNYFDNNDGAQPSYNITTYFYSNHSTNTTTPEDTTTTSPDIPTPITEFTLSLSSNNSEYGVVEGAGSYKKDTTITIKAVPNDGYQFNEWSDGSAANPRTIKVTGDTSIIAIFAPQECVIASGKCGTDLTWTLTCDSIFTIRGIGAMTNYGAYNSMPWYTHRAKVCKLRLPKGITSIGQHAFQYCAIDTLIIPESVKTIGYQAFNNCTTLKYIHFPKTPISFGESVFSVCNSLEEITIPDYFTTIPNTMFGYCAGLKKINFPNGLKSIGYRAFGNASTLPTLTLPDSVTSIGEYAFQGSYALTFIQFGEQFSYMASNSFQYCSKLKSIEMRNPTPPSTGSTSGINPANCRLFVPAESVTAYKNANWWKTFYDIVPIGSDLIVTFLDWDNTVLYVDTVPKGGTAEAPIPTKEGYTFSGWDKELTNVQFDFSVTAQFETNRYLIQFVDWDGTVLKSDSVYYQGWVEAPENPSRKGYAFMGWDKEFSWEYLKSDMTITAVYQQLQPGDAHVREDGGIHALFSVGEGKQVLFSRGNLQFNAAKGSHECADGTTQPGTWRFAPEQYDVKQWNNSSRDAEYDNWIDLFAFGATGYNGNAPTLDETTVSREFEDERSYYDFGLYNAISNGGNNPGEWRMFTQNEWRYLIQQRPHANKLHSHAKIPREYDYIYGVIVLPDDGDTTLIYKEIDYNDPEAYLNYDPSVPTYTLAEWRQLEAKGAIFFPAGGIGYMNNGYFNVGSTEAGYYLVSFTPKSEYTNLLAIGFDTTTIWSGLNTNPKCISVRLVKDVPIYHLNAIANNSSYGSISGDSIYFGEDITITATPNYGYHFVQWSDGVTEPTRALTLVSDSTIIAEFAPNKYALSFSCDEEQGAIEGESGSFDYLSEHVLTANAHYGYTFAQWSDGVTDNPRTLVLTQDTTITAIYTINYYPIVFLNWNGERLSTQSIAYNHAAEAPELPAREGFVFMGWTADIAHVIDTTYAIALYDKEGIEVTYKTEDGDILFAEHADLHIPATPSVSGKTFAGWLTEEVDNTNGIVLRATYTVDKPSENEDVNVVPSSNSAEVNFPYVTGAVTYMLVIRNLSGVIVCKIMFNAQGFLLGIAFAPGRDRNQQSAQSAGFQFTVEGLDPSTTYEYEFVAHDEEDAVIETLTGSFTTTADDPTHLSDVQSDNVSCTKVLRDDQVLILRGNKTYTVTGVEMK